MKKFTNYVLVSNGPEILPYLLYIVLPVPLALNIIHILSIDLGTDIIPSMGLGQEPADPEVMNKPPRNLRQGLLTPAADGPQLLFPRSDRGVVVAVSLLLCAGQRRLALRPTPGRLVAAPSFRHRHHPGHHPPDADRQPGRPQV